MGEDCAWTEAFETSPFNIGAAVTSVRWHFGSTIKIQQWPCCFDNQLSMPNIPAVCATWISPGPDFSSALILKKKETFHLTLKKDSNALSADKEKSYGKTAKLLLIYICIILKGAPIAFITMSVSCDSERTMIISEQKAPLCLGILCIAGWTTGKYLLLEEQEINYTAHIAPYQCLRRMWLLYDCYQHSGCGQKTTDISSADRDCLFFSLE